MRFLFLPAAAALLAGCADSTIRSATVSNLRLRSGFGDVRANVREDGYVLVGELTVSGCALQEVPVRVFGPHNEFLGEEVAVPASETTTWNEFRVFLPLSRAGLVPQGSEVTAYVIEPGDMSAFIGSARTTLTAAAPEQVWEVLRVEEDVELWGGARGTRLTVNLSLARHNGETIPVTLICRNLRGEELHTPDGKPLRITQPHITQTGDASVWKSLTLAIPESQLAFLGEGTCIELTPALQLPDTQFHEGNVHVTVFVGGTADSIAARMRETERRLDERVKTLEREFEALNPGSSK